MTCLCISFISLFIRIIGIIVKTKHKTELWYKSVTKDGGLFNNRTRTQNVTEVNQKSLTVVIRQDNLGNSGQQGESF